jgi:hypothetical protein
MKITNEAQAVLEGLLADFDGDTTNFDDEYKDRGFCYECGNLQKGVEPDGEAYECEVCGSHAVNGLALTLLYFI